MRARSVLRGLFRYGVPKHSIFACLFNDGRVKARVLSGFFKFDDIGIFEPLFCAFKRAAPCPLTPTAPSGFGTPLGTCFGLFCD